MSKRDKKIRITAEEREAFDKYQQDFNRALPHITELANAAMDVHKALRDAPLWSVVQPRKPDGAQEKPELWSVGHAKVNYVDKIKTTNDEGTQDK